MTSFATRSPLAECMDDPLCDTVRLLRTVNQFESINRWVSRYHHILGRWVLSDMLKDANRAYHLVDLGAGGCDIDVWLLREARRLNLNLTITACDSDARIADYARKHHGSEPGLKILEQNVMTYEPESTVDYVFGNHFLHHLDDTAIVRLISHWLPHVGRRMVFSDLLRSRVAYAGYQLLSMFYTGSFARADGLLSIRRGFTGLELELLAGRVEGKHRIDVHALVPGRLVLLIDP